MADRIPTDMRPEFQPRPEKAGAPAPRIKTLHQNGYNSWMAMHTRCKYPSTRGYHLYGGRGIKICARWQGKGGFANFLADMGLKPTPRHSIDRIDPDGDYKPENCRWATPAEQRANKSRTLPKKMPSLCKRRPNVAYVTDPATGRQIPLGKYGTQTAMDAYNAWITAYRKRPEPPP